MVRTRAILKVSELRIVYDHTNPMRRTLINVIQSLTSGETIEEAITPKRMDVVNKLRKY